MEEVYFEQAVKIDWTYVPKLRNRHKPCIQDVSRVFAKNLGLVKSLVDLIPAVVAIAMRYGRAELLITQKMTGGRDLFTDQEKADSVNMNDFFARLEKLTTSEEKHLNTSKADAKSEGVRAIENTRFILNRYSGLTLESGITALLRATIKDTWTAIEVLAEDLLLAVMDKFPQCFRKVVWEDDEPRFRSRIGIRDAYMKAFPVDNDAIRMAVYSDGIDALALLRNVLAHKSGLADDIFRNGAKKNPLLAPFHNHTDKQLVKIDGEIIKAVVEPAVKAICDLVMAVDTWITMAVPNPPTNA